MRNNYIQLSLENHLFFGRIMKEHSFFLMAGFPAKNTNYIKQAECFMRQLEELLRDSVNMAKGILECKIQGLILPLLADHVLREANHYLRLFDVECR